MVYDLINNTFKQNYVISWSLMYNITFLDYCRVEAQIKSVKLVFFWADYAQYYTFYVFI